MSPFGPPMAWDHLAALPGKTPGSKQTTERKPTLACLESWASGVAPFKVSLESGLTSDFTRLGLGRREA